MEYLEHCPGSRLRPYVHCLWSLRLPVSTHATEHPRLERVLPDGRVEWVLHLATPFRRVDPQGSVHSQAGTLWIGATTRVVLLEPSSGAEVLGVRFRFGGVMAFGSWSAGELLDRIEPAEHVDSPFLAEWAERLSIVESTSSRFALLEELLEERIAPRCIEPSVATLILALEKLSADPSSLDRAVTCSGLCRRQFERRCRQIVGTSPKQLQRLARFQAVAGRLAVMDSPRLAELATAFGYSDQAHMTREFREFAGLPPGRFLREQRSISDVFLDRS